MNNGGGIVALILEIFVAIVIIAVAYMVLKEISGFGYALLALVILVFALIVYIFASLRG